GVAHSGRVETVYNLEVEDDHTYFVGSDEWRFAVWAHNAECTIERAGGEFVLKNEKGKIVERSATREVLEQSAKARGWTPTPDTVRRAPAPDNHRGRYNAQQHAEGCPRLPDEYDAHHRIPQEYMDHPEFKDFDFHHPSNIQGVKGSRADVN